jgi:hypothetical protein
VAHSELGSQRAEALGRGQGADRDFLLRAQLASAGAIPRACGRVRPRWPARDKRGTDTQRRGVKSSGTRSRSRCFRPFRNSLDDTVPFARLVSSFTFSPSPRTWEAVARAAIRGDRDTGWHEKTAYGATKRARLPAAISRMRCGPRCDSEHGQQPPGNWGSGAAPVVCPRACPQTGSGGMSTSRGGRGF